MSKQPRAKPQPAAKPPRRVRKAALLCGVGIAAVLAGAYTRTLSHVAHKSEGVATTMGLSGQPLGFSKGTVPTKRPAGKEPRGMVWVPGGEFTMGSDAPDAWPAERPAHRVRVDGFWMDATEVTNADFRRFVEATGYVTVAEKPPVLEEIMQQLPPGTPPPSADKLVAASMVFTPPDHPVPLDDPGAWWSWVPGANWRHPEGPQSSLEGRENHPVVHVCWNDAGAYANWARKQLPTEAQWEFAARGGLDSKPYVWGDEAVSDERPRANIWQGRFPDRNTRQDGFPRTAPVKSFAPNGFGLFDMAGNVWEWCRDWYRPDAYRLQIEQAQNTPLVNPAGPDQSFDPNEPYSPKRAERGGSFLCHESYCASYRPSARNGTTPDTGMSHLGFRCVVTAALWQQQQTDQPTQPRTEEHSR